MNPPSRSGEHFTKLRTFHPNGLNDRINEADAAIDNLVSARDAYNQASNQLETVSERLTTCERDIARETNLLKENQQKLQTVTDDIEDLTTDIESSETGLRELLPDAFHENRYRGGCESICR